MIKPADIILSDPNAERVRQSHAEAIRELQALPLARARVITARLEDGAPTFVSHGLGRAPVFAAPSFVRGATSTGRIVESRANVDRRQSLLLTATGWGAAIEIELLVF